MRPSSQAERELCPGAPGCPWLVSHCVPGVDTEKGALCITLPGILLRTCVAMYDIPGCHAVLSLPLLSPLQSFDVWFIFPASYYP